MNALLVTIDVADSTRKASNFPCWLVHRRARLCQRRADVAGVSSTVGRPRRVTDAQVRIILEWRAEMLELNARRKTIQQLAEELQLPAATISDVIRNHGNFKQPSPELREAAIVKRRAVLEGPRVRRRRVTQVTESQLDAIERWWKERQALSERTRAVPSKTKLARDLHMARGTLDRIIARARGSAVRPTRPISAQEAQVVLKWLGSRDLLLAQRARAPGLRAFARQLGIGVSVLQRVVAGLRGRK